MPPRSTPLPPGFTLDDGAQDRLEWKRDDGRGSETEDEVPAAFQQKGLEGKASEFLSLFGGFIILDPMEPSLRELRRKIQNDITDNRGAKTAWKNICKQEVQYNLPGLGTYCATISLADVDRVAQAALAQGDFLKLTGGNPATEGAERRYESLEAFKKDAILCKFGRDIFGKPMSKSEEIDIAWAVFNHARYPKNFMVFGRMEDCQNTRIIQEYGTTTEHFQGGLLSPERWNPLINDCWMLGGIKGGNSFITVTDFFASAREECASPERREGMDEIRNDETIIDHTGVPSHFIITVASTEIQALLECGYRSTSDPVHGQVFKPSQDRAFVEKRSNYTLVDMRIAAATLRVTQAIDNLTGRSTLSDSLMGFLKPDTLTDADRAVHAAHIANLKIDGIPLSGLTNKRIRKTDLEIASAMQKLADPNAQASLKSAMLIAISNAVRYTAEHHFRNLGLDQPLRVLLLLAIHKQIAKDVADQNFNSKFRLSTFGEVEKFIDDNKEQVRQDPQLLEAEKYLADIQREFDAGILTHKVSGSVLQRERFEPTDLEPAWSAFACDLGYQLPFLIDTNVSHELGNAFVVRFLENYTATPHVEVWF